MEVIKLKVESHLLTFRINLSEVGLGGEGWDLKYD